MTLHYTPEDIAELRGEGLKRKFEKRRLDLFEAISEELNHAYEKHGAESWGRHEFYGIIDEEYDELKRAIFSDEPQERVLSELIQVAAMCFRYFETDDRYRGPHPRLPRRSDDARSTNGGK